MSRDFELIKKIKEGDSKAKLELWNKYQFFIHRHYNRNFGFYMSCGETREDFVQDSWIAFDKAVKKVSLEKMIEKDVKNFTTIFYYSLMKIKNRFQKEKYKYGTPILTSSFKKGDSESSISPILKEFNLKTEILFSDCLEASYKSRLLKSYASTIKDKRKKEILNLFLSGLKLVEISRSMDREYSEVYQSFNRIKKEIKVFSKTFV